MQDFNNMTLIKHLYLLVFILLTSTSVFANPGKLTKMSILNNDPLYSLRLNTFGMRYIIRVNGVTVLKETSSNSQLTTSLPINHWMKSGNNSIEVQVRPSKKGEQFNPNSTFTLDLSVKQNSNQQNSYKLTDIQITGSSANDGSDSLSQKDGKLDSKNGFQYNDNGDVVVSPISITEIPTYKGGYTFKRDVYAESALPLWNFFKSDDIPDIDSYSDADYYKELDKLLTEYMKVYNAISNNDIASINSMFDERSKEIDEAFYLNNGETKDGLIESLNSASSSGQGTLVPLDNQKVLFTIEPNRKLARLTRKGQTPAISLNFNDGSGSQRFEMYFRYENNNWILTR